MVDQRARYGRRLRRLRRAARRWSVLAGALIGAAVVLTPYSGVGVIDAVWAAAAGSSVMLASWRWLDFRALAAQAPPPGLDPALAGDRVRTRVEAFVAGIPGGREAFAELRRQADLIRLRGSAVAPGWHRLDRAAAVLAGLALRRGEPGETAVREASLAERELRELAKRAAGVERGLQYGGPHAGLNHAFMVGQFEQGVAGYEELVGAAVAYVAENGRAAPESQSVSRLTDTTDLLRGIALGLAELRKQDVIPA
ncbi:MAG: phage shock envelope stress response protein PspM [Micromonosporaceae bacterium]